MLYGIMAVLSIVAVFLWWLELTPFLNRMEGILAGPKWRIPIATVAALRLLLPLFFDVFVTITFIAWFGGGGVTSLVISLFMSVTLSVLMNTRIYRYRTQRARATRNTTAQKQEDIHVGVNATPA